MVWCYLFVWCLVFGVVCLKELFEHIEPLKPFKLIKPLKPFEPYLQILEVKSFANIVVIFFICKFWDGRRWGM